MESFVGETRPFFQGVPTSKRNFDGSTLAQRSHAPPNPTPPTTPLPHPHQSHASGTAVVATPSYPLPTPPLLLGSSSTAVSLPSILSRPLTPGTPISVQSLKPSQLPSHISPYSLNQTTPTSKKMGTERYTERSTSVPSYASLSDPRHLTGSQALLSPSSRGMHYCQLQERYERPRSNHGPLGGELPRLSPRPYSTSAVPLGATSLRQDPRAAIQTMSDAKTDSRNSIPYERDNPKSEMLAHPRPQSQSDARVSTHVSHPYVLERHSSLEKLTTFDKTRLNNPPGLLPDVTSSSMGFGTSAHVYKEEPISKRTDEPHYMTKRSHGALQVNGSPRSIPFANGPYSIASQEESSEIQEGARRVKEDSALDLSIRTTRPADTKVEVPPCSDRSDSSSYYGRPTESARAGQTVGSVSISPMPYRPSSSALVPPPGPSVSHNHSKMAQYIHPVHGVNGSPRPMATPSPGVRASQVASSKRHSEYKEHYTAPKVPRMSPALTVKQEPGPYMEIGYTAEVPSSERGHPVEAKYHIGLTSVQRGHNLDPNRGLNLLVAASSTISPQHSRLLSPEGSKEQKSFDRGDLTSGRENSHIVKKDFTCESIEQADEKGGLRMESRECCQESLDPVLIRRDQSLEKHEDRERRNLNVDRKEGIERKELEERRDPSCERKASWKSTDSNNPFEPQSWTTPEPVRLSNTTPELAKTMTGITPSLVAVSNCYPPNPSRTHLMLPHSYSHAGIAASDLRSQHTYPKQLESSPSYQCAPHQRAYAHSQSRTSQPRVPSYSPRFISVSSSTTSSSSRCPQTMGSNPYNTQQHHQSVSMSQKRQHGGNMTFASTSVKASHSPKIATDYHMAGGSHTYSQSHITQPEKLVQSPHSQHQNPIQVSLAHGQLDYPHGKLKDHAKPSLYGNKAEVPSSLTGTPASGRVLTTSQGKARQFGHYGAPPSLQGTPRLAVPGHHGSHHPSYTGAPSYSSASYSSYPSQQQHPPQQQPQQQHSQQQHPQQQHPQQAQQNQRSVPSQHPNMLASQPVQPSLLSTTASIDIITTTTVTTTASISSNVVTPCGPHTSYTAYPYHQYSPYHLSRNQNYPRKPEGMSTYSHPQTSNPPHSHSVSRHPSSEAATVYTMTSQANTAHQSPYSSMPQQMGSGPPLPGRTPPHSSMEKQPYSAVSSHSHMQNSQPLHSPLAAQSSSSYSTTVAATLTTTMHRSSATSYPTTTGSYPHPPPPGGHHEPSSVRCPPNPSAGPPHPYPAVGTYPHPSSGPHSGNPSHPLTRAHPYPYPGNQLTSGGPHSHLSGAHPGGHQSHLSGAHPGGHQSHGSGAQSHSGGPQPHPGSHLPHTGPMSHIGGVQAHPGGPKFHPSGPQPQLGVPHSHSGGSLSHPSGLQPHPGGSQPHPGGPQSHPGGPPLHSGGPQLHPSGPELHAGSPQSHTCGSQRQSGGFQSQSSVSQSQSSGSQSHQGGHHSQLSGPQPQLGGPLSHLGSPQSQPGRPQSQPGGPQSQPGGPQLQPGGPQSQPGRPQSQPGRPQSQPGGLQSQPGGPQALISGAQPSPSGHIQSSHQPNPGDHLSSGGQPLPSSQPHLSCPPLPGGHVPSGQPIPSGMTLPSGQPHPCGQPHPSAQPLPGCQSLPSGQPHPCDQPHPSSQPQQSGLPHQGGQLHIDSSQSQLGGSECYQSGIYESGSLASTKAESSEEMSMQTVTKGPRIPVDCDPSRIRTKGEQKAFDPRSIQGGKNSNIVYNPPSVQSYGPHPIVRERHPHFAASYNGARHQYLPYYQQQEQQKQQESREQLQHQWHQPSAGKEPGLDSIKVSSGEVVIKEEKLPEKTAEPGKTALVEKLQKKLNQSEGTELLTAKKENDNSCTSASVTEDEKLENKENEFDLKFDKLMQDLAANPEGVKSRKSRTLGKRYEQKLKLQEAIDNDLISPMPVLVMEEDSESEPEAPVKFRGKFKSIKDKAVERVILIYASHSDESATEMIPDEDASDFEEELKKELKAKKKKSHHGWGDDESASEERSKSKKSVYKSSNKENKPNNKQDSDFSYTTSESESSSASLSSESSDSDSDLSESEEADVRSKRSKNLRRGREEGGKDWKRRGRNRRGNKRQNSDDSEEELTVRRRTRRSRKSSSSEDESEDSEEEEKRSKSRRIRRRDSSSEESERVITRRGKKKQGKIKKKQKDKRRKQESSEESDGDNTLMKTRSSRKAETRKKSKRKVETSDSLEESESESTAVRTRKGDTVKKDMNKKKKGSNLKKCAKEEEGESSSDDTSEVPTRKGPRNKCVIESESEDADHSSKVSVEESEVLKGSKGRRNKKKDSKEESDVNCRESKNKEEKGTEVVKEALEVSKSREETESSDEVKEDSVLIKLDRLRKEEVSREDVQEMQAWVQEVGQETEKQLETLQHTPWRQFWKKPVFGSGDGFTQGWQDEVKQYKEEQGRLPRKLLQSMRIVPSPNKTGTQSQESGKDLANSSPARIGTSSPAKNTRSKTGIVKTSMAAAQSKNLKVAARPEISSVMQRFFDKVLAETDGCDSGNKGVTKKFALSPFADYGTSRCKTGLTPTPSVAPSMMASDDSDRESLASLRTDIPASDSVPVARNTIANSLMRKLNKKFKDRKLNTHWLNRTRPILETTNKPQLLPTPGIPTSEKEAVEFSPLQLKFSTFFRKETVKNYPENFKEVINKNGINEFTLIMYNSRTRTKTKEVQNVETIKAVFGVEPPPHLLKKVTPMKNKKQSKLAKKSGMSMITDPQNKEAEHKKGFEETSPIPFSRPSTPVGSAIVTNGEEGDEDEDEMRSERSESLMGDAAIRRTARKTRRKFRKFRSGFDYIRKKKKVKPEEDTVPTSKKRQPMRKHMLWPEESRDVGSEVRGWVVNKGLGETVVHKAARLQYHDVVVYCAESGDVDINVRDNAGYTPLHEACNRGHLDIAQVLCAHGAHVNAPAYGGMRPLHEAIENGHAELARLLLSYGADPALTTYSGQTCLSLAADSQCRALMECYLADLRGRRAQPWYFSGPSKHLDAEEQGYDIFRNIPDNPHENVQQEKKTIAGPENNNKDIKTEESENANNVDLFVLEVEMSEEPLPDLYRVDGRPDDYVLMKDLMLKLHATRNQVIIRAETVETVQLMAEEFERHVHCRTLGSSSRSIVDGSAWVELVKYSDPVKRLFSIHTHSLA